MMANPSEIKVADVGPIEALPELAVRLARLARKVWWCSVPSDLTDRLDLLAREYLALNAGRRFCRRHAQGFEARMGKCLFCRRRQEAR